MLDSLTRKAFFISNYDFQVLLQNVLIELGLIKEYGPLFERTIFNAVKVLKLKKSVIFFYNNGKKCYELYSPFLDENVCVNETHPIFEYFMGVKDAVSYKKITDDLTYYRRGAFFFKEIRRGNMHTVVYRRGSKGVMDNRRQTERTGVTARGNFMAEKYSGADVRNSGKYHAL
jgi:hypothetical protein